MAFERVGSEVVWEGKTFTVRVDRFRHEDGEEAEREIVDRVPAVAVVAHDGERLFLVKQPREAVGEPGLLELPAGKVDGGEEPLATAQRELAEEIGKAAESWEELARYYATPGFASEEVFVFLATGLRDEAAESEEQERIEVVEVPLGELDRVIEECRDSKTLVGLLRFRARQR